MKTNIPPRRESLLRALTVLLAPALALSLAGKPARILLAALVPALVQAVVIVWLDRDEPAPLRLLVSSFLWGAVAAAMLSMTLNQQAGEIITDTLGRPHAETLTPVLAAPLIEEIAKGVGIVALVLLRPRVVDPVLDGIVCGALVGIGFAMTENINYLLRAAVFGGALHLPEMMYQRIIGSLNHPIFSASFGAGIGLARLTRRWWPAAIGMIAAVGQHVVWNGVTSQLSKRALCGPLVADMCGPPTSAALFVTVPLVIILSLAPGSAVLAVLVLRALRRQGHAPAATDTPLAGST